LFSADGIGPDGQLVAVATGTVVRRMYLLIRGSAQGVHGDSPPYVSAGHELARMSAYFGERTR
jgi:hypothetical protein